MRIISTSVSIWTLTVFFFILTSLVIPINVGFSYPDDPATAPENPDNPVAVPPTNPNPVLPALPACYPNQATQIFDVAVGGCIPLPHGFEHCPNELVYDSRVEQCVVPPPGMTTLPGGGSGAPRCDPATEVYDQASGSCVPTGAVSQGDPCEDPAVVIEGCPQISSEGTPPSSSEPPNGVDSSASDEIPVPQPPVSQPEEEVDTANPDESEQP